MFSEGCLLHKNLMLCWVVPIFLSKKMAFYLMTILCLLSSCGLKSHVNVFAVRLLKSWEWTIIMITLCCCFKSANKS